MLTTRCVVRQYLIRFIFEHPSASTDGTGWACTGLDDQSASELPDGEQKVTARRWAKLVLRCATALKRSQSNISSCYITDPSIALQLTALGAEHAAEILELSEKELPLSSQDGARVLELVNPAIKSGKLQGNNGAKAGLSAIRWLAGSAAKLPAVSARAAAQPRRTAGGARRVSRSRVPVSAASEVPLVAYYSQSPPQLEFQGWREKRAAGTAGEDSAGGGGGGGCGGEDAFADCLLGFYSARAQAARRQMTGDQPIPGGRRGMYTSNPHHNHNTTT